MGGDTLRKKGRECVLFPYHAFPCPWIKVAKSTLPPERGEKFVGLNGEKDVQGLIVGERKKG